MSRENKELRVTELDFEKIKENYKEFLKSQEQFTDYDFDASGMDVILDLFAYNTHYNAFYLNSAVNETFIASANNRSNVTKKAKSLNYVPKSKIASKAYVDLRISIPEETLTNVFGDTNYGIVQLGKYTRFTSSIDGKKYTFVNTEPVNLIYDNETNYFTAKRVEIMQGIPNTFRYTVNDSDYQKFVIPNENVDTSTLEIYSIAPNSITETYYTYHKDVQLQNIGPKTFVYFLSENSNQLYEVEFGDGNYGYKPIIGETIYLNYLLTDGAAANGASIFQPSNNILLSGNVINNAEVYVINTERSAGGAEKETTESVRFNAPKYFQAQDRAIIDDDVIALILNQFSYLESVNAWGGENNIPPQYGKVFITAKPRNGLYITDIQEEQILNFINNKLITSLRSEFVQPKYTYLKLDIDVKIDSTQTRKRSNEIKSEIIENVLQYNQENLEKYKVHFYYSQLLRTINNTDDSIISTNMKLRLKKLFKPNLYSPQSYTFYFQNEIYYPYKGYIGSVTSSVFTYNNYTDCYLYQNSSGHLSIISRPTTGVETVVVNKAGTIDYKNGIITLDTFLPNSYYGNFMELMVDTKNNDVSIDKEFILDIQNSDINTNIRDIINDTGNTISHIDDNSPNSY